MVLLAALIAGPGGGSAKAQIDASTRLEYSATDGSRCMSGEEMRAELTARLGRDPIQEDADRLIQVRVTREGREWVARISMRDGASVAQRELRSAGRGCGELTEDLLLTLTLLIDTPPAPASSGAEESPEPEPEPAPEPEPEPEPEPALEIDEESESEGEAPVADDRVEDAADGTDEEPGVRLRIHLAALAAFGALPKVGWGAEAGVSLTFDALALTLGVRYVGTRALEFAPGDITSSLLRARAMFSYRVAGFEVGALFAMGALFVSGNGFDIDESAARLSLSVGGLAAYTLQLTPAIGLRAFGELLVSALGTDVQVDEAVAWHSPAVSGALGIAFVWGR